jgi:hypothetical protein
LIVCIGCGSWLPYHRERASLENSSAQDFPARAESLSQSLVQQRATMRRHMHDDSDTDAGAA